MVSTMTISTIDPELEKILAEEEAIERANKKKKNDLLDSLLSNQTTIATENLSDEIKWVNTSTTSTTSTKPVPVTPVPVVKSYWNDPPWRSRGITLPLLHNEMPESNFDNYNSQREAVIVSLGIPNKEERPDVVQSFGEFYLLEAIASGAFLNPRTPYSYELNRVKEEALQRLSQMVARLEPIFLAYFRMVIWGEARYHKAIQAEFSGNGLHSYSRTYGWFMTTKIEEIVGVESYLDAIVLFNQLGRGGVGGRKWANIAQTVYDRMSGKYDAFTFMDRAFHLQHNGGVAFNKIEWSETNPVNWPLHTVQSILGPAQAAKATNIAPLYMVSGPEVKKLWKDHIRKGNKAAISIGQIPVWDRLSEVLNKYNKTPNRMYYDPSSKWYAGENQDPLEATKFGSYMHAVNVKTEVNKIVRRKTTEQKRQIQKTATYRKNRMAALARKAATAQRREERRKAAIENKLILKAQKDVIRLLAKQAKIIAKKIPCE